MNMYSTIRGKIKYSHTHSGDYRWWKIKFKHTVDVLHVLHVYHWFDSTSWDGGGTPPFPPSHVYFYRSMNMQVPLLCIFLDRSRVLLRRILGFKTTVVGLTFKSDGTKDESA